MKILVIAGCQELGQGAGAIVLGTWKLLGVSSRVRITSMAMKVVTTTMCYYVTIISFWTCTYLAAGVAVCTGSHSRVVSFRIF